MGQRKILLADIRDRLNDRLFKFSASTAGDPTTGYWGLNNADPTLATEIRVSDIDLGGVDISVLLASILEGDILGSVVSPGSVTPVTLGKFHRYQVRAGGVVNNGTYYTIPVTYQIFGGTVMAADDRCLLRLAFNTPPGSGPGGDEFVVLHADIRNGSLPASSDRWMGAQSFDAWKTTWLPAAMIAAVDLELQYLCVSQGSSNAPSATATTQSFGFDIENGTTIHAIDPAMGWTWGPGIYNNIYVKDLTASGFTINGGDRYAYKLPSTAWVGNQPSGARITLDLWCKTI